MLATFGVLLTQANFTPVSVFPFESWAVAENDCTWLGEMDAFRGVMLMVAGGPVELDEEPPQLARETLMASKHISTAARRVVLRASSISMILEANLPWRTCRSAAYSRYPLSTLRATLSCQAGCTVRLR